MSRLIKHDQSESAAGAFPWNPSDAETGASRPTDTDGPATAGPELNDLLERSRCEGYEAGVQAGEQRAGIRMQDHLDRLSRAVTAAAGTTSRLRHEAEGDVVKLAIAIAARILHREIQVDPEALLGVVKAALSRMTAGEVHRIRIDPELAQSIAARLPSFEVVPDAKLGPGGLVLETVRGRLDASVSTQLKEVEQGFLDLLHRRR